MNQINIQNNNWIKILTRPFTLFSASLWNKWYTSDLTKEIFGSKLSQGLFVEYPKGMVRQYRAKEEFEVIKVIASKNIQTNPKKYQDLLKEAELLNKQARANIKYNSFNSVKEAVDFLTKLALLSTILPYVLVELTPNKKIFKKVGLFLIMLRGVSLYPIFIKKVIEPLVELELKQLGVTEKQAYFLITYKELLQKDLSALDQRVRDMRKNKKFIYYTYVEEEKINWVSNSQNFIKNIESDYNLKIPVEIKGIVAYGGKVTGRARLIFSDNIEGLQFNQGEIVIASSTSPCLMPLLKKAAAIVTDEGGILSHASIVARELKIPCIIGTKVATEIIKDGDLVEVDANKGMVKKIS